ncbi:MAG: benzoate transporter [Tagaea sp. CACIAM 22H2]|nr:benzoate transporter [Tagaea sp. CACIAM 22H2]
MSRAAPASAAFIATIVGFGGTVALVVAAASAVGATQSQIASSIAAVCFVKAIAAAWLSWRHRIPLITAWATAGAALIASTTGLSFDQAVGAYLVASAAIVATAFVKPLGDLVARIPTSIAAAMLAGVVLPFVAQVFVQAGGAPALVLPLVVMFLVVRLFNPHMAVVAVLAAGIAIAYALDLAAPISGELGLTHFEFVAPSFDMGAIIGLGLPLYLVTMASQNLAGFAVLKAAGYPTPTRDSLAATGIASFVGAFAGAIPLGLAAITASICAGPEAHPDKGKRWISGIWYAFYYLLLAAFAGACVAILAALPKALIATFAGLGLVGALQGALTGALKDEAERFPAVLTLAVTASGVSLFGIGSAFWGLAAGIAALAAQNLKLRQP